MAGITGDRNNGKEMGTGMALGIVIGVAIGISTDNLGLWIPIGVALGARGRDEFEQT